MCLDGAFDGGARIELLDRHDALRSDLKDNMSMPSIELKERMLFTV